MPKFKALVKKEVGFSGILKPDTLFIHSSPEPVTITSNPNYKPTEKQGDKLSKRKFNIEIINVSEDSIGQITELIKEAFEDA